MANASAIDRDIWLCFAWNATGTACRDSRQGQAKHQAIPHYPPDFPPNAHCFSHRTASAALLPAGMSSSYTYPSEYIPVPSSTPAAVPPHLQDRLQGGSPAAAYSSSAGYSLSHQQSSSQLGHQSSSQLGHQSSSQLGHYPPQQQQQYPPQPAQQQYPSQYSIPASVHSQQGYVPAQQANREGYTSAQQGNREGYSPIPVQQARFASPAPVPVPGQYQLRDEEGEGGQDTFHYGDAPARMPRRHKTKLVRHQLNERGHFIRDMPIPQTLLAQCPRKGEREFEFCRYTAVTCEPDDFWKEGFTLRQSLYKPARRTEILIVITSYNEGVELYARTMSGVMKNIAKLCARTNSKTWRPESDPDGGWKKVVVVFVSDGRLKMDSRTKAAIAAQGCYFEGVAKNEVAGKPVTAHLFEYTTQVSIDPSTLSLKSGKDIVPVQLIFCLKEKNQKKINSHRWFFNAFGRVLEPNVCVLLDVGTRPEPSSIYHLWKVFDLNSSVGGACGEIVADKGRYWKNLINPLVAAQNFEYKMSNILDKPLESVFGFITVLPGAFSAYRYAAIQNDLNGQGPLERYFLGETMHGTDAGIFEANMYLAEDRILCWELVSKRHSHWTLKYVKSAAAYTDVPDKVDELISQRRRWLNGSFFAQIHAIAHFGYLYRSDHGILRKFWLHVEAVYQLFNLIFAWTALANYYIAFSVLTTSLADPAFNITGIHYLNIVMNWLYITLLLSSFILALGNRPQGSKWSYTTAIVGFAIIVVYMTFAAVFLVVKGITNLQENLRIEGSPLTLSDIFTNAIFRTIVISLVSTTGVYFLASFIHLDFAHMFTSFLQYLLLAPSYTNVLNVYAFANVHDVSWGTKGDTGVASDLGVVKAPNKDGIVEVAVPDDKDDTSQEAEYVEIVKFMKATPAKKIKTVNAAEVQAASYATFRTNVLLAWVLTNLALVVVILSVNNTFNSSGSDTKVSIYLSIILYSVAGLAAFRFIGSVLYLIIRLFRRE